MRYSVRVAEQTAFPHVSPRASSDRLVARTGRLDDGCLRGERRWERNVAAALLAAGRKVGAHQSIMIPHPARPDWLDKVSDTRGCTYIAYGGTNDSGLRLGGGRVERDAAHYVLNFFGYPGDEACGEIEALCRHVGRNNVAVTLNFKWDRGGCADVAPGHAGLATDHARLCDAVGEDLIAWLPTPAVPCVYPEHDTQDSKMLLWANRGVDIVMDASEKYLWPWVAHRLARSGYTLELLTGMSPADIAFREFKGDVTTWFWQLPRVGELRGVRDKITVHGWLDWYDVLAVYGRARAMIGPPQRFGGPPLEAAAYGVPTIGIPETSSFHDWDGTTFPEYLSSPLVNAVTPEHTAILDRLLDEPAFFRATGDAYRTATDHQYTYAAFVRELDALSALRGWT